MKGVTAIVLIRLFAGLCQAAASPHDDRVHLTPIEQIAAHQLVWAQDENSGEVAKKRVLELFKTHPDHLHHVSIDTDGDGQADETLSGTAEHPFWDQDASEWVRMGDLKAGTRLHLLKREGHTASQTSAYVLANQRQNAPPRETFTTYNFEVEDFHTYFVGESGVWVHNTGAPCERIFSVFYSKAKNRPGGVDGLRKDRFKVLEETKAEFRGTTDIPTSSWAQSVKDVQSKMAQDLAAGKIDVADMPSVKDMRAFNRRQPAPGTAGNHVHHAVETWIQRDKLGLTEGFDDVPGWMIEGADHTFGAGRPKAGTLAVDLEDAIKPIAAGNHLEVTTAMKQVYQNRGLDELWDVTEAWLTSKGIPTP
jgi:hypothetical protein